LIALSSLSFYGFWKPQYILLLLLAAVVDYYIALEIDKRKNQKDRRSVLLVSLVINLGLLFYFKYLVFLKDNLQGLLSNFGNDVLLYPDLKIVLPIGISFYTFETISYTVDVYRRHLKPEKNFISYLSFLVYFPHLIAGPVLRASDILPQFASKIKFQWSLIIEGFKKLVTGLFLKVVLADNISPLVDQGFTVPMSALSAVDVWTLAFLFGFQIYFDFCAYSAIAIGAAKMMGITFFENFDFPYMAVSPKAFWKRWHISLSKWIRDYLYLPLAGKTVVAGRQQAISEINSSNNFKGYFALFLTWGIMGFWHGANWTFIAWGLYHAFLVSIHRYLSRYTRQVNTLFSNVAGWCVSLPFLMLGWIFFRAKDLNTASTMLLKTLNISQYRWMGLRENVYLVTFLLLCFIIIAFLIDRYLLPAIENTFLGQFARLSIMSVMIALVIVFLRPISQFIYFQF
jgi:D-alanyl-lipoteichoic acid acyltransferase DltB (MBOAT superfamily)